MSFQPRMYAAEFRDALRIGKTKLYALLAVPGTRERLAADFDVMGRLHFDRPAAEAYIRELQARPGVDRARNLGSYARPRDPARLEACRRCGRRGSADRTACEHCVSDACT